MATKASRYEYMTLSELISDVMERQRISYEGLAERARRKPGVQVSAAQLCNLVRQPLIGLRDSTVKYVAAATGIDETIVAAAAMRSWGYHLYRATRRDSETVVLSPEPLTADQVGDVVAAHDQVVRDIESEVPADRDRDTRAIVSGSASSALGDDVPNPRSEPRTNNGRRARHIVARAAHPR